MALPPPIIVTAFVDWNSQIHSAAPSATDPNHVAQATLSHVVRKVTRVLSRINTTSRYDVTLRIYHGWHRGFEVTSNRKALISVAALANFVSSSTKPGVLFRPNILYGDRLFSALADRLHVRLGIHLPATHRWSSRRNEFEEKMVDTAIAADVVDLAHREPDTWIAVLGDDDDLVPPLFTAEAAPGNRRRVILISDRPAGSFLRLGGLLVKP